MLQQQRSDNMQQILLLSAHNRTTKTRLCVDLFTHTLLFTLIIDVLMMHLFNVCLLPYLIYCVYFSTHTRHTCVRACVDTTARVNYFHYHFLNCAHSFLGFLISPPALANHKTVDICICGWNDNNCINVVIMCNGFLSVLFSRNLD